MSIELMKTLSLTAYILAGLMLLAAVLLFFVFDIRRVVGDITGSSARKAIENIRQRNEATGDKTHKPSAVNAARGMLTDRISASGRLERHRGGAGNGGYVGTAKFHTSDLKPQINEPEDFSEASDETSVLGVCANETTVLTPERTVPAFMPASEGGGDFTVDVEIGFAGSSESIE